MSVCELSIKKFNCNGKWFCLFWISNYECSKSLIVFLFLLKPKKASTSAVTAGLTDEQLKAGWAPADIEYPFVSILHTPYLPYVCV